MHRSLQDHYSFVSTRLDELRIADAQGQDVSRQAQDLASYHKLKTSDFQHERMVHLLVTLFFGCLFLAFLAGGIVQLTIVEAGEAVWTLRGLAAGCLITAVLEAFYIRHYYLLENGVQKLYQLDRALVELSWTAHPKP